MSQIQGGEIFTDVSPGKTVTSTRLNNHVNGADLLNGAVIDQSDVSTRPANPAPIAADRVLLGDSTQSDTAPPLSCRIDNLLMQSQRDGTQRWGGVAGGSANALTLATSPASTGAYVSGETVRFRTGASANTGAVTLNLDGRGVVNLYSIAVAALVAGDLPANAVVEAVYDGTQFQMVAVALYAKQIDSLRVAEKLRGNCQQYATAGGTANAITVAPLDSSGAPTFTALYDGMIIRFKAASTNTAAVTLSVNGQGTPALVGPNGAALTPGQIQTGQQVAAVYDLANTRFAVISPLYRIAAFTSSLVSLGNGGELFGSAGVHSLGAMPTFVRAVLVCPTGGDIGYAALDEVDVGSSSDTSFNTQFMFGANATNVYCVQRNAATPGLLNKSTGAIAAISAGWKMKMYASL